MGATNCILLPPQGFNLVLYGNDKESKIFPKDRSQRHRKRVKEMLVTEIDGKWVDESLVENGGTLRNTAELLLLT
jgi:hypothetical protein